METVSDEPVDVCASALSAIVSHGSPPAQLISELASHKDGFATGWLVLHFIKHMEAGAPLRDLDLSEFSLDAGKLGLLLSSVPVGPILLETLKGELHVCTGPCLFALKRFLQRATSSSPPGSLKNLNLSRQREQSKSSVRPSKKRHRARGENVVWDVRGSSFLPRHRLTDWRTATMNRGLRSGFRLCLFLDCLLASIHPPSSISLCMTCGRAVSSDQRRKARQLRRVISRPSGVRAYRIDV